MHRFPEGTSTSAEIAKAALAEYLPADGAQAHGHDLWQSLSNAARAAAEAPEPDWPRVKALWLVADAASMLLQPDSVNTPFKPLAVFEGSRSAIPEDFCPDDAALFSQTAEITTHRMLRGRLSDIAWLRAKPKKNIADARRAIDAYTAIELDDENWVWSQHEWTRAIVLCMQLRQAAEGLLIPVQS